MQFWSNNETRIAVGTRPVGRLWQLRADFGHDRSKAVKVLVVKDFFRKVRADLAHKQECFSQAALLIEQAPFQ